MVPKQGVLEKQAGALSSVYQSGNPHLHYGVLLDFLALLLAEICIISSIDCRASHT